MILKRLMSYLGPWGLLVYTIGGFHVILALGLIGAIIMDMFIQWHAPQWPFASLSEFLQCIRVTIAFSAIMGFMGVALTKK